MTAKSSFLFAFRLIFSRADRNTPARRSILGAVLCIGISLVPFVVVLTVANGMIQGMTERILGLSSSHLQVSVLRRTEAADGAENLSAFADMLKAVPGVKNTYPEIDYTGLAAGKAGRTGAQIRAVRPSIFGENDSFRTLLEVTDGSLDGFLPGTRTAVIGGKISETLGVRAGDRISLITAKRGAGRSVAPKIAVFTVCAVVSSGYQELDALWVFVPADSAYSLLSGDSASYSVLIETRDAFSPDLVRIQDDCIRVMGAAGDVFRWDEVNAGQFQNFSSTRLMLMFVMLLIVIVASVNISAAMVMVVMERRREIAVLKSLGGTRQGITLSFLFAGIFCGCAGVAAGIPAGLLCAVNINEIVIFAEKTVNFAAKLLYLLKGNSAESYAAVHLMDPAYYLTEIPVAVPFRELFLISAAAVFLALAASVIPAVRAGKRRPLEMLRKI